MRSPIHLFPATMLLMCGIVRADSAGLEFFEKRIRPVLVEHCHECHGEKKQKGGLRLDSSAGWIQGGDFGPAIVPGKPDESHLITAVRRLDKDMAMPPKKELPQAAVQDLIAWVKMGAPAPADDQPKSVEAQENKPAFDYAAERKKWAFRFPQKMVVPPVPKGYRVRNEIDAFISAKLAKNGLKQAPTADPHTLIRRLSYDLTGLPPASAEVDRFVEAAERDRHAAVAELVDSLLASPHYGERWGRHWLDVVRYAESRDARAFGKDGDSLDAWRYRDWVVRAFNDDLPYSEFVTQQIAGDLLAARNWDPNKVIATSVYAIGNWGNGDSDKQKVYSDIVDDQIDLTGRAFLGLTLACARCHDHKFDPITAEDYYGLAGFFFSSHIIPKFSDPTAGEKLMRIPLLSPEEKIQHAAWQQRLKEIETKFAEGLHPLTEVTRNVAGITGLNGRKSKEPRGPSFTANASGMEARFSTITLPAGAVSLHPAPKKPVTAVWKAPAAGTVQITAKLMDADGNCGDGIEWTMRHGSTTLGSGVMDNRGSAEFAAAGIAVQAGDLVRLVIGPRGEYTCDSTQVEFTVRSGEQEWDLQKTMLGSAKGAFTICQGDGEKFAGESKDPALEKERKELAAKLAATPMSQGLQDGGVPDSPYEGFHDVKVHVRGRYDRLGELVPRRFPKLLADEMPHVEGSGRLQLARWVASEQNPLTARVMVNRIWQHHFGAGIVRTTNNFGKLGEPPTHPELLDWLATRFIEKSWSVKEMHRLICTSETYQQASSPVHSSDPDNRWLGRQHRRRLSAEELRDTLLVATERLDRTLHGPSVNDINTPRRTLYLTTIRSDRSSYQLLFDGADPTSIVEQRTDSVVAPQALWLLNHPFARAQSEALASRLAEIEGDRLDYLTRKLFGRSATTAERRLIGDAPDWRQVSHALICSNELLYVD